MKKYIISKYNYYFIYDSYAIIFNSLSGKMLKTTKELAELIQSRNDDYVDELFDNHDFMTKAYELGFIKKSNNENASVYNLSDQYFNNKELFLIIMPTEKCNLRCIYCYEKFEKGKMKEETQKDLLLYLENNIGKYNRLKVSWFGGEPLLAIDIIENLSKQIISICEKNNIVYEAEITTNGTLLTESVFEMLLNYKVMGYQVTLDGLADVHDMQRKTISGKGTFERILNNLRQMKKKKTQFSVVLRTNIGNNNRDSINQYIDLIYDEFGNDERFLLHLVAIADLTGDTKATIDLCDTCELFPNYKYAQNKGIKFDFYRPLFAPTKMMCYASDPHSFVIGSDGSIYKCSVAFENEQNQIGFLEKGEMNLDKEKLNKWICRDFDKSKKCSACKFLPICFGKFCPLEKIMNNKEPCPPFCTYIEKYFELF